MHIYQTRYEFDESLSQTKKWHRAGEALDQAAGLLQNVAYSIGDSLTYWWDTAENTATEYFIGHRRYLTMLYAMNTEVTIEAECKTRLTETKPYNDLTDREIFTGEGRSITIPKGGIFITDIDEAIKLQTSSDTNIVLLHVTVEGYSFPNK